MAEVVDAAGLLQNFATSVGATSSTPNLSPHPHPLPPTLSSPPPTTTTNLTNVNTLTEDEKSFKNLQRDNANLRTELAQVFRLVAETRQERNTLMDLVYEREVQLGYIEVTSGSSDEEEDVPPSSWSSLRPPPLSLSGKGDTRFKGRQTAGITSSSLVFHHMINTTGGSSSGSSSRASTKRSRSSRRRTSANVSINPNVLEEESNDQFDEYDKVIDDVEDEFEDGDEDRIKDGSRKTRPSSHPTKRKRIVKSAEAAAATPRKAQPVPRDLDGKVILPLTIGMITVHELGHIVWDRPGFHNKRYLYPAGYHSSRSYHSAIDSTTQTVYHSRILDENGAGPVFDVVAEDAPHHHYQSTSPTGAWTAIVKQINSIRGRTDYSNSASGPDFYGLSNNTISMVLEELPNTHQCEQYQRKTYDTSTAGNVTGITGGKKKKASSGTKLTISRRVLESNGQGIENPLPAPQSIVSAVEVGRTVVGANYTTATGVMDTPSSLPVSSLLSGGDDTTKVDVDEFNITDGVERTSPMMDDEELELEESS